MILYCHSPSLYHNTLNITSHDFLLNTSVIHYFKYWWNKVIITCGWHHCFWFIPSSDPGQGSMSAYSVVHPSIQDWFLNIYLRGLVMIACWCSDQISQKNECVAKNGFYLRLNSKKSYNPATVTEEHNVLLPIGALLHLKQLTIRSELTGWSIEPSNPYEWMKNLPHAQGSSKQIWQPLVVFPSDLVFNVLFHFEILLKCLTFYILRLRILKGKTFCAPKLQMSGVMIKLC